MDLDELLELLAELVRARLPGVRDKTWWLLLSLAFCVLPDLPCDAILAVGSAAVTGCGKMQLHVCFIVGTSSTSV